jgi:hypothetical protein
MFNYIYFILSREDFLRIFIPIYVIMKVNCKITKDDMEKECDLGASFVIILKFKIVIQC